RAGSGISNTSRPGTKYAGRSRMQRHRMQRSYSPTEIRGPGMPTRILLAIVLAGSLSSIALAAPAGNGSGAEPHNASGHEQPTTPDQVIGSLDQTLGWYRDARLAMRGVGSLFGREDEQTALAVLRRAFETARAQAALLAGSAPAAAGAQPGDAGPLTGKST